MTMDEHNPYPHIPHRRKDGRFPTASKENPMKSISRRSFLKNTAIGSAVLAASPFVFIPRARAAWAKGTAIHPNVDNLRVVGITDPLMARGVEPSVPWSRQEELVVTEKVWENMDRLACGLTENRDARQAWQGIFIKPPGKSWSDTVVAIKTNNIGQQHTRSAVMSKVCHTLVHTMGVTPGNIHIYDACHGGGLQRNTPFSGLPEGCRIEGKWGSIGTLTPVPEPWRKGRSESECLRHLVDGSVDILVNIAMCKGHSSRFGGFTMTMKNHFGTFSPSPGHQHGSQDYLMAINATREILGPMDKKSGRVLFPRQQLCLIDALWASRHGPGGNPSHQPHFLAMGVLSPVVDYLVATRFRGDRMGWEPNREVARRMLTEFGYKEQDLRQGGRIIEI
jgi:hypothetical protein